MHKETGLEIESDWLLDGYGIGSAPAAIRRRGTVRASERNGQAITRLGYPAYFVVILGFWKVLAGIALLAPRYPRLKEWAYAGAFFDLTGAAASHLVCGSASWRVVMTIVLAALAVISWALRPPSRTLGILFPPALFRRKKEA
jgi:DoxX-like family